MTSRAAVPALLADFDVVVVHHDERDPIHWSPRLDATFLLREPLEVSCRRGIASPPASEYRCANLPTNHGSVWDGAGIRRCPAVVSHHLRCHPTNSPASQRLTCRRRTRTRRNRDRADAAIFAMVRGLVRKPLGGVHAARRIEAVTRTGAATRPAVAVVIDILKNVAQDTVEQHRNLQKVEASPSATEFEILRVPRTWNEVWM